MHTLGEIIGLETMTLAEPKKEIRLPSGDAHGAKSTPKNARANLGELEGTYKRDPVIFNTINRFVEIIMAAGWRLVGNKKSVEFIEDFLNSVGKRGGDTEWSDLLENIFKHQCVYGRSYIEIIYNIEGNEIMDLDFIDPKKMDYAKDAEDKIVLDGNWNSVGFTQSLPFDDDTTNLKTDKPPKDVSLDNNQIFFVPERVAQFKLYTIGDGFYGIGLIEPVLVSSRRKLELERALANIYLRTAFPTKYATVGNDHHEATDEMLQRVLEQLQVSGYDSVLAIPDYVKLDLLEPQSPEKMQQNLDYFIEQEVTGMGVPRAFALGSGEETNRATLARQEYLFKLGLNDVVERTTKIIETEIFAKLARFNNLPDVPKIEWGEIVLEELDSRAERLVKYVSAGIIQPDDEIEKLVRNRESLPKMKEGGTSEERIKKDSGSKEEPEPEKK